MKVSRTYSTQLQGKNLNNSYYQDRLAEQREQRQQKQTSSLAKAKEVTRNQSCTSHNQKMSNPGSKQFTYVSGKPKANLGAQVYEKSQSSQGIAAEGSANHYGGNQNPQRSVLSIKNAAQVIKRKNSFGQQNQTIDLRVNIKQNSIQKQNLPSNAHVVPHNMVRGKNVPNGLLRRATAGTQGTQKSIGNLSNYMGTGNLNGHQQQRDQSIEGSYARMGFEPEGSISDELHGGQSHQQHMTEVNPPAIISNYNNNAQQLIKNKSFGGQQQPQAQTSMMVDLKNQSMLQQHAQNHSGANTSSNNLTIA
jgi:hypothetical protein